MHFTNTEIPAPAVSTPTEIQVIWKGLQSLNFFHTNSQLLETWDSLAEAFKVTLKNSFPSHQSFSQERWWPDSELSLFIGCVSQEEGDKIFCCGISLPYVDYFRNISSATMKSITCYLDLYSIFGQSISIGLTKLLSWDHRKICCLWGRVLSMPVRHCHSRFQHLLYENLDREDIPQWKTLKRELWAQVVSAVKINPQAPQAVPQDRLAARVGVD